MRSAMVFVGLFQFMIGGHLDIWITGAGSHQPLPSAHVRLVKLGVTVEDVSRLEGRMQFSNLTPGRYTLIVDAPGYETNYSDVSVPEDFVAMVDLRPRQAPAQAVAERPGPANPIRRLLRKLFG